MAWLRNLTFLFTCSLFAGPWFTGPLLSPEAVTIPAKHTNWQPYLFVSDHSGVSDKRWKHHGAHDSLTINPSLIITRGITDYFDVGLTVNVISSFDKGQHQTRLGDTTLEPALMALKETRHIPSLRISVMQSFPTGKYQRLDPKKLGTDSTGSGTFTSAPTMVFQKLIHFRDENYLRLRFTSSYAFSPPVHLHGLNTYGGGIGTKGKVYPGNHWTSFVAGEYTFNQNWVGVLEAMMQFEARTRFSGKVGRTDEGFPATMGAPSSKQFSLAPAIEYNWSAQLGIIAGVWFSVLSHNTDGFISGVVSINYLN